MKFMPVCLDRLREKLNRARFMHLHVRCAFLFQFLLPFLLLSNMSINDNSAFCIRITSKHGSNGGHSDETALMELPTNTRDASTGGATFCNMIDGVQLGGKTGVLVYDTGASGCANLLWLLGRGGPPKKSWNSVGLHSEGFLSAVRAFKSPSLRAISRYDAKKDVRSMRFNIQDYLTAMDPYPIKDLDPQPFLTCETLGGIETREWLAATESITNMDRKTELQSLLSTDSVVTFTAYWLENTELWPIFKASEMKINTNYYGILLNPDMPLTIRVYSGDGSHIGVADSTSAIDAICDDTFPQLMFECVSNFVSMDRGTLSVRLRIPGSSTPMMFTINQDGVVGPAPEDPSFVPEFTLYASAHSKAYDVELAKTVKRSVEMLRGVFIERNGVVLGDPYWNIKEFGDPRNAGSPHLLIKIHTDHMGNDKNKQYAQDIIPTAAIKHTSNLSKAWMPVQKLLRLVMKDLIIKNYTGPEKPYKLTGITSWNANEVGRLLGIQVQQQAAAPAAPLSSSPSISQINKMTKAICLDRCHTLGLDEDGTLDVLRERLVTHYHPEHAPYSIGDLIELVISNAELFAELRGETELNVRCVEVSKIYKALSYMVENINRD
jgi:hypothetical protein